MERSQRLLTLSNVPQTNLRMRGCCFFFPVPPLLALCFTLRSQTFTLEDMEITKLLGDILAGSTGSEIQRDYKRRCQVHLSRNVPVLLYVTKHWRAVAVSPCRAVSSFQEGGSPWQMVSPTPKAWLQGWGGWGGQALYPALSKEVVERWGLTSSPSYLS